MGYQGIYLSFNLNNEKDKCHMGNARFYTLNNRKWNIVAPKERGSWETCWCPDSQLRLSQYNEEKSKSLVVHWNSGDHGWCSGRLK
jgi:hypothetical protein